MLDYNRKVNPIPSEMGEVTQRMIDFASKKRLEASSSSSSPSTTTESGTEAGAEEEIAERAAGVPPILGQLTVNEYEPGQGIAAHIDTFNCLGPEIFVLSLGGGVTITW